MTYAALRHNIARSHTVGGSRNVIRLIKRYESRKLYDTEESRYVSLEEMAQWIRKGQEVKVVDNATGADVTSQTLTQIILEEGRQGRSLLPSGLLHELVRRGEKAVTRGAEEIQRGWDRLVRASVDRLGPLREAREEMARLRERLEELEAALEKLETEGASIGATGPRRTAARQRKKKSSRKTR